MVCCNLHVPLSTNIKKHLNYSPFTYFNGEGDAVKELLESVFVLFSVLGPVWGIQILMVGNLDH